MFTSCVENEECFQFSKFRIDSLRNFETFSLLVIIALSAIQSFARILILFRSSTPQQCLIQQKFIGTGRPNLALIIANEVI